MMMRDKNEDFVIICKYLSESEHHKHYTLQHLKRFIFPPIELGQYKIFDSGFLTYALINEEVEKAFVDSNRRLQKDEWNCGDRFWYMHFICLGGPAAIKKVKKENLKHFGHLNRKYMRTFRKNKHRYVVEQPPIC
tara:strand:+ start:636 stop:1040 length:405 start_codon:yes stop_codon:yes gene_type:complete